MAKFNFQLLKDDNCKENGRLIEDKKIQVKLTQIHLSWIMHKIKCSSHGSREVKLPALSGIMTYRRLNRLGHRLVSVVLPLYTIY